MKEYKLVVMGSGGVGKSALTVQYVQGVFLEKYDPTIEDSYRKQVEIETTPYILEILDTAGTEQFVSMREIYTRNGHGFILVFSVTSNQTLLDLQPILEQIYRIKETDEVPIIIVGNKIDLESERVVSTDAGRKFALEKKCLYVEVSAMLNTNVHDIFKMLIKKIDEKTDANKKKKGSKCSVL